MPEPVWPVAGGYAARNAYRFRLPKSPDRNVEGSRTDSSAGLIMESLMASIFRPWIEDYALSHSLDLGPSRLLVTISGRHSQRMRHSLHGQRRAQEFQIPLRL